MLLSLTLSVRREPNQEAKFSICRSFPAPTFTYGHELLVVTEKRVRSSTREANMSFLRG